MNLALRVVSYCGAVLGATGYAVSPFRIGVINGESMSPTYHTGGVYLMRQVEPDQTFHEGEVVVFRRGGLNYIKRVLAVPGDTFYVEPRNADLAEENLISRDHLKRLRLLSRAAGAAYDVRVVERQIPRGCLYVVGDNLELSEDSRSFGFVTADTVIGTVIGAPPSPRQDTADVVRPASAVPGSAG